MITTKVDALVVEGQLPALELRGVLQQVGATVSRGTVAEVLAAPVPVAPPDLVLVPSSLAVPAVAALTARIAGAGTPPVVMAYADVDLDTLGRHIVSGLDYLVPPYLPAQVRARLERFDRPTVGFVRAEHERRIGREIQEGFLPAALPAPDGWELEARLRTARDVGGDFFDGFELVDQRRLGFVVADVCDKGIGAALFMALMRTLLRHTALQHMPTDWTGSSAAVDDDGRRAAPTIGSGALLSAISATSKYMTDNHLRQGYFATVFFGVLDPLTGGITYVNGGHNAPVLRSADGVCTLLHPTGPAVGMLPGATFAPAEAQMEPGDVLFAYTDGVTEAKDEDGGFFTQARMLATMEKPVDSATQLLDRFEDRIRAHVGRAEQFDDITMLVLRRLPVQR